MKPSTLKILTIASLIISTSTYAATKKELDKSSPMLAKSSVKQSIEKKKAKQPIKRIDKASTKSSNPLHKPQTSKAVNPMYQPSNAVVSPKDAASGLATGKRTHEKGSGRTTGDRVHKPKG